MMELGEKGFWSWGILVVTGYPLWQQNEEVRETVDSSGMEGRGPKVEVVSTYIVSTTMSTGGTRQAVKIVRKKKRFQLSSPGATQSEVGKMRKILQRGLRRWTVSSRKKTSSCGTKWRKCDKEKGVICVTDEWWVRMRTKSWQLVGAMCCHWWLMKAVWIVF